MNQKQVIDKMTRPDVSNLNNEELLRSFLQNWPQKVNVEKIEKQFWNNSGDIGGFSLLSTVEQSQIFDNAILSYGFQLGIEIGRRMQQNPIQILGKVMGSQQIGELMLNRFKHQTQEHLWLICLDTKNQIKKEVMIFKGGLNSIEVHPREIMVEALKVSANGFILVHNHPSGDPSPSNNDLVFTRKMRKVGKLLGIELIDHLIIGEDNYWSAAEAEVLSEC